MRDNGAVTNQEIKVPEGVVLVSRTDTAGIITYANQAFIDVSGFTRTELIGAPHNLIRHPDMPQQAFADLWKTIKRGKPWQGLVKNRCKNGDHYWVFANVTPEIENRKLKGYISIRTRPPREHVAAAEKLYANLRKDNSGKIRIEEGRIIEPSVVSLFHEKLLSIRWSFNVAFGVLALMMIFLGIAVFFGMNFATTTAEALYEDGVVFSTQVSQLTETADDIGYQISAIAIDLGDDKDITKRLDTINRAAEKSANAYQRLAMWAHSDAQRTVVKKAAAARDTLMNDAILPALVAANRHDDVALKALLAETLPARLQALKSVQHEMNNMSIFDAGNLFEHQKRYGHILYTAVPIAFAFSIVVVVFFRQTLITSVRRPLNRLNEIFDLIAENDVETQPAYLFEPVVEFRRSSAMLRALRAKLGFAQQQHAESERHEREQLVHLAQDLEGELQKLRRRKTDRPLPEADPPSEAPADDAE